MLSMQSTIIYCCVGGLCGAPLHGSWVVLKRALYTALSGRRRAPGQLKGRHFFGVGGRFRRPPESAPEQTTIPRVAGAQIHFEPAPAKNLERLSPR